jgi:hypothetical protein
LLDSRAAQVLDPKPKYPRLNRMYGTDEPLCNGPVHLSVIGWSSTALCGSSWECGGEGLEYVHRERAITPHLDANSALQITLRLR